MPRCVFIVQTNPVPGREDEYNNWYTNVHLPDVLKVPGIVSAQRFRRTAQQRGAGPYPWDYLAIYECESEDVAKVIAGLTERSGTPAMVMSTSLAEARSSCFYEAITELKTA